MPHIGSTPTTARPSPALGVAHQPPWGGDDGPVGYKPSPRNDVAGFAQSRRTRKTMIARAPQLHRIGPLLLLAYALLLLPTAASAAVEQPKLSIRSGNMTGAYYAAASAVAKVFNRAGAQDGMRLTTAESEGIAGNIDAVLGGQATFGSPRPTCWKPRVRDAARGRGRLGRSCARCSASTWRALTIVARGDHRDPECFRPPRETDQHRGARVERPPVCGGTPCGGGGPAGSRDLVPTLRGACRRPLAAR